MSDQLFSLSEKFNNTIFRIPDYQRGYAWRESQLIDFWEDLINLNPEHYHYTGMLSLKRATKEEVSKWGDDKWIVEQCGYKPYYVVDGQQRLTTCVILINEIINIAEKYNVDSILSRTLDEVKSQYILKRSANKINSSYLFGYEIDNPSFKCLRYEILGEENAPELEQTFYTQNLLFAKSFFEKHLQEVYDDKNKGFEYIERIYQKLTTKFMFNVHEIEKDFDVFVAFETMNNRGKKLSNLELLKNRLIYLTTLYKDEVLDESGKEKLRKDINDSWKEVYHQLGRKKDRPLNDDEFLRSHWSLYFTYSRNTGDDYVKYLLKNKFTPRNVFDDTVEFSQEDIETIQESEFEEDEDYQVEEKVDNKKLKYTEIQDYVKSLNFFAKFWYYTYYPFESTTLTRDEKIWVDKLNNVGINYFRPLVMVALSKKSKNENDRLNLLKAIERFIFIYFRLGMFQASYKSSQFMLMAKQLLKNEISFETITETLESYSDDTELMQEALEKFRSRMKRNYNNYDGYYSWRDLRYFLYEYELSISDVGINKIDEKDYFAKTTKDKVSIEHIYPQTPDEWYWVNTYRDYSESEKKLLAQSLGNLLPLSRSINSSLQNYIFEVKKKRYEDNSFSASEVARNKDWSPKEIYNRGVKLFEFMAKRWQIDLMPEDIDDLLNISFVKEERDVSAEIPYFEKVVKKEVKEKKGKKVGNAPITLEEFLSDKNEELVSLFKKLLDKILAVCPDTQLHVLPQYVGLRKGKWYYADLDIQRKRIRVMSLKPDKEYSIGESVPDKFLWALKYRIFTDNEKDIDEIVEIVKESYDKR